MKLLYDYNPSKIEHLVGVSIPAAIVAANSGQFVQDSKEGKAGLGIGVLAGLGAGIGGATYLNSLDLANFNKKREASRVTTDALWNKLETLPTDSLAYLNTKGQINEAMESPYAWNKGTRNEVYNANPNLKKGLVAAQLLSLFGLPITSALLGASIGNSFSENR